MRIFYLKSSQSLCTYAGVHLMTKKGALCTIIASLVKKCRSRLGKVMVSTFVLETLDLSRHWKAVDLHSLGLSLHNSHSTESSHFPFLSGQRSTSEKRKKEVLYLPSISLEVTFHAHLGKEKRYACPTLQF